jgi:predicted AAA+ superfamily ATPase
MIIIHGMNDMPSVIPRHLTRAVARALDAFPVVILTGARQTGKSTLIRELLPASSRDYRTLDDIDVLDLAEREPEALLEGTRPITIDEIQRSPKLLLAIKRSVDRARQPGRFLLSGSANLALLGTVSDTLAGRAVYLTLYPFTAGEQARLGTVGAWERVLTDPSQFHGIHAPVSDAAQRVLQSGFPPTVLNGEAGVQRAWLDGYVRTYLERDLQALSTIENLIDFRRLMRVAALRSGALVNQTEMARDVGLSQPTVHRYLNLLEASYLFHRLPAYAVNRTKRLIKTPRLFFCDSGLAAFLAGVNSEAELEKAGLRGPLLETLVFGDLLAWRETVTPRPDVSYWRTASGAEVDFVIEQGGTVVPIEIKSTARPQSGDIAHLRLFLDEYKKATPHGILIHTGPRAERLADRIWAIPLSVALGLSR